jgi:membrane protease YdiL (CAAX protease family)
MTVKERFTFLSPFSQVIFLLLVGTVSFFLVNVLLALIIQFVYPKLDIANTSAMIVNYPSLYMVISFLPFQLGFLLFPGALYFFYLRENSNKLLLPKFKNTIWASLLFITAVLLLPFFSEINHAITKALGVYAYLYELKSASDGILQQLLMNRHSMSFITAILLIGVLAGIAEELIFRGFLFNHLLKTTNHLWLSILASGFLFALLHFNYFQLLPLIMFGIVLAIIYYITKSLIPGIILHAINNMVNVYWIRYDNFPYWLESMHLEITIPSTLLLMGLLYIKRFDLKRR